MLTNNLSAFIKYPIFCVIFMQLKLPFKLKILYLTENENTFQGKAVFHEKDYSISVNSNKEEKTIRVPFSVMGVTENKILVRFSGPSGVYVEDYLKFKGKSEGIEIESDIISDEISNNQDKLLDTLEIFVK